MSEDISTGELRRRLDSFERNVERRFDEMNRAIQAQSFVSREVYVSDNATRLAQNFALESRINELEESKKRTIQMAVGGALLPIIVIIVIQLLQLNS